MLKITIKNLQKRITIHPRGIRRAVLKTLSLQSSKKTGEITICFVSDKEIKQLNSRYLHKNSPTDVLAFDMTERFFALQSKAAMKDNIFADIVISTDRAVANAKIFKTTHLYELYLYVVHAVMHLIGYGDKNASQRRLMHRKSVRILDSLKLCQ